MRRRAFLGRGAAACLTAMGLGAGLAATGCTARRSEREGAGEAAPDDAPPFAISLAQWSLHRALRGGALAALDFPREARRLGFDAIEYVNSFHWDEHRRPAHTDELRRRCADQGVRSLLIMCDGLGALGDPDPAARARAAENHRPWLEAAHALGCHSIRVNAQSAGSWAEQRDRSVDGLARLADEGARWGLFVLVENHGGLSSNGRWLAEVMGSADHPWLGTLPDFGNFRVGDHPEGGGEQYDRYRGVAELMPFARAVSAKSHDFDANGDELHTDYRRMLDIVLAAGYRGHIGVEYEGGATPEEQGVLATKSLLERVRAEWSAKSA
jgi:L-ribulose-5-phosphate 3-epimerase